MSTCCASDKIIKVCKNLLLTEMFPQKLGDVLRIFHMTTPFDSHRLCPLAHSTVYFHHYPKPWKLPTTNTTNKEPPAASSTDEDIVRASTAATGDWWLVTVSGAVEHTSNIVFGITIGAGYHCTIGATIEENIHLGFHLILLWKVRSLSSMLITKHWHWWRW